MKFETIHVQKVGATNMTLCGRRMGTPGGHIYPGVRAELPVWFRDHPYPDSIAWRTCRMCARLAGKGDAS